MGDFAWMVLNADLIGRNICRSLVFLLVILQSLGVLNHPVW